MSFFTDSWTNSFEKPFLPQPQVIPTEDNGFKQVSGQSWDTNTKPLNTPQSPKKEGSLYKTELCRSFEETGICRYGPKCQFAHGGHELRPVIRHPKYKTEICNTFYSTGACPYGKRCRFIHSTESKKDNVNLSTNTSSQVSVNQPNLGFANTWNLGFSSNFSSIPMETKTNPFSESVSNSLSFSHNGNFELITPSLVPMDFGTEESTHSFFEIGRS